MKGWEHRQHGTAVQSREMQILYKSRETDTVTDSKITHETFERLPMLPITPSQNQLVSIPECFAEVRKSPNQPWEIFMWSEIPHIEDVRRHNTISRSHRFRERI